MDKLIQNLKTILPGLMTLTHQGGKQLMGNTARKKPPGKASKRIFMVVQMGLILPEICSSRQVCDGEVSALVGRGFEGGGDRPTGDGTRRLLATWR
jgi:hypothetical protein